MSKIRYWSWTLVQPTLSHGLDGDDFTGVSTACSSDGHHPDAVLTVPAQVRDAVEKHIWGSFKLAAYLGERQRCKMITTDLLFQLLIWFGIFQRANKSLRIAQTDRIDGECVAGLCRMCCGYDWVEQYVITAARVLMPGQLRKREQRADLGLLQ